MDETAAPSSEPAQTPPSLDQVYKDYNIEAEAQQFRAPPVSPPPPTTIPDPVINTDAFTRVMSENVAKTGTLESSLAQALGKLNSVEQTLHETRVRGDILQAVKTVNEELNADPDMVEVALDLKARKDPRFQALWNNRAKNPQALQAALKAIAGELKDKFAVRQDPQLTENQRALKAAQSQLATTTQPPGHEWGDADSATFERRWNALKRSGY